MGPRCSSAETQVCHRSYIIAARPIPVSMFHEDGTMRKSCKSDLVKQFENEISPVLSLTTYIRDGMALVQCMDAKKHRTFGDLATDYCRQLTSCFAKAYTVADVFDRYDVKKTPSSRLKESVVPKWLPIQRCSKS